MDHLPVTLTELEVYADLCEIENRPFDVWQDFEDWLCCLRWNNGEPDTPPFRWNAATDGRGDGEYSYGNQGRDGLSGNSTSALQEPSGWVYFIELEPMLLFL